MPYIKQERRDLSEVCIFRKHAVLRACLLSGNRCDTAGELNYCLTQVIRGYLEQHGLSYQTCNDIVGALDNAKDEFRRRVQHSLEDRKIAENGDVYTENEIGDAS
jgi:hypothetical protein